MLLGVLNSGYPVAIASVEGLCLNYEVSTGVFALVVDQEWEGWADSPFAPI